MLSFLFLFGLVFKVNAWSTDKESLRDYAVYLAIHENLNVGEFLATLKCEGDFYNGQSKILNPEGPNGYEDSWGVVQIHLPSHPTITKEQALNPFWALNWMSNEWASKGNKKIWSCWHTSGKNYLSSIFPWYN